VNNVSVMLDLVKSAYPLFWTTKDQVNIMYLKGPGNGLEEGE